MPKLKDIKFVNVLMKCSEDGAEEVPYCWSYIWHDDFYRMDRIMEYSEHDEKGRVSADRPFPYEWLPKYVKKFIDTHDRTLIYEDEFEKGSGTLLRFYRYR